MENRPLISVSMPAFNAARYIEESIQSVLSQTYDNFELIIYDDGSTDATREILLGYVDPRIKIILGDVNKGLIFARNTIAREAKGKYLALLDADDIASPERFEKQVAFLESGKADICGGAHYSLYESTGRMKLSKQRYSDADIRALITICSPLCNPAVMGRAEVLKRHPYQTGKDYAEDYSLWTELALAGYRFANLREILITYRIHSEQTSQVQNPETNRIFNISRSAYLVGLGMGGEFLPKSISLAERLKQAIPFMLQLNQIIPGISVLANYEIYARFQFRGNGLLTPLTRLERLLVSVLASLRGRF